MPIAWRLALRNRGKERLGFLCLTAGSAGLLAWGHAAGLSLPLGAIFVLMLLLTAIGMARLRLDAGLPVVSVYFLVPNLLFFARGTGPGVFSPSEYVALAFLNLLSYSGIAAVTMLHVEGWKMSGALRTGPLISEQRSGWACSRAWPVVSGRCLNWCTIRGSLPSIATAVPVRQPGWAATTTICTPRREPAPAGPDLIRMGAVAAGFAVTAALSFLRTLFTQLPFPPAGFVYGTGIGYLIWGSALIGWTVKVLVVRYGGAAQYRRLRPFFMGLIVGDLLMRLMWAAVSLLGEPGGGYRI